MPTKNPSPVPKHIAIIPDGNRRWAMSRGLRPWEGHFKGIGDTAEEVARTAFDAGVQFLTVWAGSYDNLTKRSRTEVRMLNEAYRQFAEHVVNDKETHDKEVRVSFLGEWRDVLEEKTIQLLQAAEDATGRYSRRRLTILVAYNGDREMLQAIEKFRNSRQKVAGETLKSFLWTADMPPVDLLIRTGVEDDPHNSAGFMMWDTRYSQLYFSNKMWPEFGKKSLFSAIDSYSARERRLGK